MNSSDDKCELRAQFETTHGYWNKALADLLDADARYFSAYSNLIEVTAKRGNLTPVQRELICVAVNAQVTYLNPVTTKHHIHMARELGASAAEISETLQLASSLGTHSMLVGVPIAHEVFTKLGVNASTDEALDERRQKLKEDFIATRKYWSPHWDTVLAYTPEYFEAYLNLSGIPWTHGVLDEYFKELIYIAIDVATTHLFVPGLQTHTEKAVSYGATPDQVIDVMTLSSEIGIHTALLGVQHLNDESIINA